MTRAEWRDLIADTVGKMVADDEPSLVIAATIMALLEEHQYGKPLPTTQWAEPRDDVQSNG